MVRLTVAIVDPDGPVAEAIADLWWLMLGLGTAVFVLFAVLLVVGLLRAPATVNGDKRADPAATSSKLTRRWVLAGGVVMPVGVLLAVFGATLSTMRATPAGGSREALKIDVVGHQWWFEVRYPDHRVVTRNELHLPVGRVVELRLTSTDVIHSLWIPALGGKMDMLPDKTNVLVLEAAEAAEYRVQCAEFCGLHHAGMRMRVVTEPADRLASWLAAQQ